MNPPSDDDEDDGLTLHRMNSRGVPESKDQEISRLRQERTNLAGEASPRRAVQKLQDVETLVSKFTHADVLKLMSAEPTSKGFKPPRAFWRRLCTRHRTKINDLCFDTEDWQKMHLVVKRALEPWVELLMMEDSLQESVVSLLIQNYTACRMRSRTSTNSE